MTGEWQRAVPYALALFFMCWALRGAASGDVCLNDAARHAMNGAYVYDLARAGKFTEPIAFGKYYYSRLPALSLPYHPPLFPVIEAGFFAVFGVNLLAARLAIALSVAVSVLLLYHLIVATHGSRVVAAATVLTFFTLNVAQQMATDVMLEFPALAFMLASLLCLRDPPDEFPLRRGLAFAVLAAAAVWTKQHTVFLGLVPFFYLTAARRWRALVRKTIWISSALLGVLVLLVLVLPAQFNWVGYNQVSRGSAVSFIFLRNLQFYWFFLRQWFGPAVAALLLLAFLASLFDSRRFRETADPLALYVAWAGASLLLLLLLDAYDDRYLLFTIPALIVIGYTIVSRLCRYARRPALALYAPLAVAVLFFAVNLNTRPLALSGPSQAAGFVLAGQKPLRVLYCGQTNGSFIFAIRSLDPQLRTVVIRGDKLPASYLTREGLEDFAHRYGIEYVILERTSTEFSKQSRQWAQLLSAPATSMVYEREVPLVSSEEELNGTLHIYRFTNPAPNPENRLSLPTAKIDSTLELNFEPNY